VVAADGTVLKSATFELVAADTEPGQGEAPEEPETGGVEGSEGAEE
jgi:hypothetical protein